MIIDAWMQHPNAEWIGNPMFDSLRRWKPSKWSEKAHSIQDTLAEMDRVNVSVGMLCAWHGPSGPMISNDEVAQYCRAYPNRFVGIASVDLFRTMEAVRELRLRVKRDGFKGLRVLPWLWGLPPDDRRYYPLFAECCEAGGALQFSLNEVPIGIPMPAVYCEIIKHAVGPRAAFELTLFGQVDDLTVATRLGIVQQTVAPNQLVDAAVAWAALVPPDFYKAYAFSKRALQATTMAAIDYAARLDRDWLSRGMSDLGSIRAHARRYKELKGREITWPLPA
jgi:Amidohydrolase/Enoyl-CoA hydratase/isomerase